MNIWTRLRSWTLTHQRWFALWSMFSVFGLFALIEGDVAWLGCLGFLGFLFFLAPRGSMQPSDRTEGQPHHTAR